MKLSPAQQQVSNSDARFRCLVAGRRFGKSFLSINEIAKYAHQPKRNVIYVAPTRQMAKTIIWDELKARLLKVRWVESINESELTIRLRNGSKIMVRSGDNPDASRGLSLDAAIIDEAQGTRTMPSPVGTGLICLQTHCACGLLQAGHMRPWSVEYTSPPRL